MTAMRKKHTRPTPATAAQLVSEEFAVARRITRESWSEREVLASLDRAETVTLLALALRTRRPRRTGAAA